MQNRHINEDQKSKQVRTALEAALAPGEALLEYLRARRSGLVWGGEIWIGLSDRRFIFVEPGRSGRAASLAFEWILDVSSGKSLQVRASMAEASDTLRFIPIQPWQVYAAGMAEKYRQASARRARREPEEEAGLEPAPVVIATVEQRLKEAEDLGRLGARRTAAALLDWCLAGEPQARGGSLARQMKVRLAFSRRAAGLASGILGVAALYLLWFALQGQLTAGLGVILNLAALAALWRGGAAARPTGLGLALLGAALNISLDLQAGLVLDAVLWGSFGLALGLLLAGLPGRRRIAAGGLVFALGWVGVLGFSAEIEQALSGLLAQPFRDDFSTAAGWPERTEAGYSAGLENGAYFMQVSRPDATYFAFPPLNYFAGRGEVDVRLPAESLLSPEGGFGLACRYQENPRRYYVVYFDPLKNAFAVGRFADGQGAVLTSPAWQPLSGPLERIGLACQDNTLTVSANGVQAARISDPLMAQFGAGPLGLMVTTWTQAPPQGFKVFFDNAQFWPGGNP